MIIERNTFHLKYGRAKESIAIWKQVLEVAKEHGMRCRLMTDVTGPSYTLILDVFLKGWTDIGPKTYYWFTDEKFRQLYEQFKPMCEWAEREYFKIEFEG